MNRDKRWERFLFGCLLVAIIVGTVTLKTWVVSVEQRLADNLEIHWAGVGTDDSQTITLRIHEHRLRRVERATWVMWDERHEIPSGE